MKNSSAYLNKFIPKIFILNKKFKPKIICLMIGDNFNKSKSIEYFSIINNY